MLTATLLFALAAAPLGDPWPMHVIDNTSIGADGVRLADFDGDGHLDIATGWEEGGSIRIYRNPGPEAAKSPWPSVVVGSVGSPEDAVLADLDGDGAMDVVSCSEGKERKIWVHWAPSNPADYLKPEAWKTEALPAAENQAQWMFALPMEVDGRHGVDLVAGSKNEGAAIGWFESPAEPRDLAAWQWRPIRSAGWVMSLIAEDMDGDGDQDVVYTDRRGEKRGAGWLRNPGGEEAWEDVFIGGGDHEVMFINRAPLGDKNGWICTVRGGGLLHFTPTPQGPWNQAEIPMPEGTGTGKGVAVADLTGDGKAEIVVTCENSRDLHGVFYLEHEDDGWRHRTVSGIPGTKYDLVIAIDLDGDGDLDVLTCEEAERLGVVWYENPGD